MKFTANVNVTMSVLIELDVDEHVTIEKVVRTACEEAVSKVVGRANAYGMKTVGAPVVEAIMSDFDTGGKG